MGAVESQQHENLETYGLIWLDPSVNKSRENIEAQTELRKSINHLVIFENYQKCLQYIKSSSKDDRIILLVNGGFGRTIVPEIVEYRQIVSIYVYCMDTAGHERWAQRYNKVKAVISQLPELIHRIHTDHYERRRSKMDESLSISRLTSHDSSHEQSVTSVNGKYLNSQLLIDCLMNMKPDVNDRKELISLCKKQYEGDDTELQIIKEFETKYSSNQALRWYTRDSFLYRMLNKALRVQNIDILFLFRFIIRDIEQGLQNSKCSSPIHVYRAQLMSKDEIQMLKDLLGELIAVNSFFSTSYTREEAQSFFRSGKYSNDAGRVIFEIDAGPQHKNSKPFSDISSFSWHPREQEVLFMVGSIFRIIDIDYDKDGILNIKMKLCSLSDGQQKFLEGFKEKPKNGKMDLLYFADNLYHMGKFEDAKHYYQRSLNQHSNNDTDIASCYYGLAGVAYKQEDYPLSLKHYQESLKRTMQMSQPDDESIAGSYVGLGNVYTKMEKYVDALEFYNKALSIYKEIFGEEHPYVAMCNDNMGVLYEDKRQYSDALELYRKAFSIREKCPDNKHRHLGNSHKHIGNIHRYNRRYDLALSHYKSSLKIYRRSLTSDHPDILNVLKCIGNVCEQQRNFQQALSHYKEAAQILRYSFPSTDSDAIRIDKDIQHFSSKIKSLS